MKYTTENPEKGNKKTFSSIKAFLKRKTVLLFLNGFIVASLLYLYGENKYEGQLFKAIAAEVNKDLPASIPGRQDSILVRSLNITHYLMERRMNVFGSVDINAWKAEYLWPLTYDLMTGKGACGSHAMVLGRVLRELGFKIRISQMKVKDLYGGHIIVEAKTDEGWKVLDALYNLSFTRPDGKMAGFKDVQADWNYYKSQVPSSYNMDYRYEDVRYTNWNKIPVVLPAAKKLLSFVIGKDATDTLSIRSFVLKKYQVAFNCLLIFYILLILYTVRVSKKEKRLQQYQNEDAKTSRKEYIFTSSREMAKN